LLNDQYRPLPVKRKEIDKPDGGIRLLGIPTASRDPT
jgi:RNA-directed DNA polymerase